MEQDNDPKHTLHTTWRETSRNEQLTEDHVAAQRNNATAWQKNPKRWPCRASTSGVVCWLCSSYPEHFNSHALLMLSRASLLPSKQLQLFVAWVPQGVETLL